MLPEPGLHRSAVQGLPSSSVGGIEAWQSPLGLHLSAPLQASPSLQLVPAATGTCCTPRTESQTSFVQGLASSSVSATPLEHCPSEVQISRPLQTVPSSQADNGGNGVCATPEIGSQVSAVHAFPSFVSGGGPARQTPAPSHASRPSHTVVLSHAVPKLRGVCRTLPSAKSQVSSVQGLPSSSIGGAPLWQDPVGVQTSPPLHAMPSEHAVPGGSGEWKTPDVGSQVSAVQGFPSSRFGGVPARQIPCASQVSAPSQTVPLEHPKPAGRGEREIPAATSQASTVHGLPSSTSKAAPATHRPTASQLPAARQASAGEQLAPWGSGS